MPLAERQGVVDGRPLDVGHEPLVQTGSGAPHQSDRPLRIAHDAASASSAGMSMGSSTWPSRSRRAFRKA